MTASVSAGAWPWRDTVWRACLALTVALLAACAEEAPKPEAAATSSAQLQWERRQASLAQIHDFSLQGRLGGNGVVSFSGDLSWEQSGDHFEARFYGPLGVGAVAIVGTLDGMEVRTKDGTYQTRDPEELMMQKMGFTLPVSGLRFWVLGIPAPTAHADSMVLDDSGHVLSMVQDGWQVQYGEYVPVGSLDLPHKFTVADSRRGFRIVIDNWASAQ